MNPTLNKLILLPLLANLLPFICSKKEKPWVNKSPASTPKDYPPDNQILEMLFRNYDQRIRPVSNSSIPGQIGPVLVKVNMLIRMLSNIDVVNMEYSMQITFREQWMDRRLAFAHLLQNATNQPKFLTVPYVKSNLWLPDSFFPTEKSAHRHMIDTENMFLRIYSDGTILYSARLSLVCSCPMRLQLYPLDVQHCDFDLISYAHTTRDIVYEWDTSSEPVQLKGGVGQDLPNFLLENIDTGVECASHTNTGTYACLRMRMKLTRLMTYFVLQLYLPTTMIVIVSWVSFWIDMHSTAGRVALAMTTLLTITTMQSSINAKLPPVNYVKVVDVWLGTCQTFVFGALIEYAVVCYRDNSLRAKKSKRRAAALRHSQPRAGKSLADPINRKNSSPFFEHSANWEANYDNDRRLLPCTCDLRGINGTLLASLGMGGATLSTLIPISMQFTELPKGSNNHCVKRRRSQDIEEDVDDNQPLPKTDASFGNERHSPLAPAYSLPPFHRLDFMVPSSRSMWKMIKKKLKKPNYLPARIDYYARILMPMGFLVFNVFYWGICLLMSANQYSKAK